MTSCCQTETDRYLLDLKPDPLGLPGCNGLTSTTLQQRANHTCIHSWLNLLMVHAPVEQSICCLGQQAVGKPSQHKTPPLQFHNTHFHTLHPSHLTPWHYRISHPSHICKVSHLWGRCPSVSPHKHTHHTPQKHDGSSGQHTRYRATPASTAHNTICALWPILE